MNYPREVIVGSTKYVPGIKWLNGFTLSTGHLRHDDLQKFIYLSMVKQKKLLTKNFLFEDKETKQVETRALTEQQQDELYKGRAMMDVNILLPNYSKLFSFVTAKKTDIGTYLMDQKVDLSSMIKSLIKEVLGEDNFFDVEFIHVKPGENNQTLFMRINFNLKYSLLNQNLVIYFVFLSLITYTLGLKIGQEEAFKEITESAKDDPGVMLVGKYVDAREYSLVTNLSKAEPWHKIKEALPLTKLNKDAIAGSYACHQIARTLALSEVK